VSGGDQFPLAAAMAVFFADDFAADFFFFAMLRSP
jgi:hypothetical protein